MIIVKGGNTSNAFLIAMPLTDQITIDTSNANTGRFFFIFAPEEVREL
jgi:hypothetical protein